MRDEIENKASIQVLDVDASAIDATWTHQLLDHSIKVVVVGTLPCNLMQSSLIVNELHQSIVRILCQHTNASELVQSQSR